MNTSTYLQRIQYSGPLQANLATLQALQRAHLLHVPFENLDIHQGVPIQLDLSRFYRKVVEQQRGGFCYELNGLFGELLRQLGFAVDYVSARVASKEEQFNAEFDHLVLLVHLEEQSYLCDVGFGEFTFAPLALQTQLPQADPRGTFLIETYDSPYLKVSKITDEKSTPQYLFDPRPRQLEEFAGMCQYHQSSPDSLFTKNRLITRPTAGQGRITLTDEQLKIQEGETVEEIPVKDHQEFKALLKKYFQVVLLLLLLFVPQFTFAQEHPTASSTDSQKGDFYFYWGYNRSFFSKTNLHFSGPNYDFTLYDLTAADRPTPFGWTYVNPGTITVPQYNFRIGYFLQDRWLLTAGMDHMKYIVSQQQPTRISGVISEAASGKYVGAYLNAPISLEADLLTFEHTNGFNFLSLDIEYLLPMGEKKGERFSWSWNFGLGGVWIITKTDVRVLTDGLDNDFHIAGYAMGAKMGPRLAYKNRFFLAGEVKGGYATLPSVLIKNAEPELGDHNLGFVEYYFVAGVYFGFKKKARKP